MKELAIKTLEMCGLTPEEIKEKLEGKPAFNPMDLDDGTLPFLGRRKPIGKKLFIDILDEELPENLRNLTHKEGYNYNFEQEIKFEYVLPDNKYHANGFVNVPNNYAGSSTYGVGNTPEEALNSYIENAINRLEKWAEEEFSSQKGKINTLIEEIKLLGKEKPAFDFSSLGFEEVKIDFAALGFEEVEIDIDFDTAPNETKKPEILDFSTSKTQIEKKKKKVKAKNNRKSSEQGYTQLALF
jgi:hypothetical protein